MNVVSVGTVHCIALVAFLVGILFPAPGVSSIAPLMKILKRISGGARSRVAGQFETRW
jgi:hypothetical protein